MTQVKLPVVFRHHDMFYKYAFNWVFGFKPVSISNLPQPKLFKVHGS